MKPWTLPLFILVVARWRRSRCWSATRVLTPLSLVIPPLRRAVVARYSALAINPAFRRRAPEGEARALWHRLEAAASVWAIALIALTATGVIPLRGVR